MASYNIVYRKNKKYAVVIYSNSYINPIQDLKEISLEIRRHINTGCPVLFDMLLSNGENFNRFAEAFFDGTEIRLETMEIVEMNDRIFLNEINTFYENNFKALNASVLSPSERFKFAKK